MGIINGKERLPYLDYARVFVAFLVIFGHSLLKNEELVRPHIYAFHMPFFFLVSGMLHKDMWCIAWKKYLKTLIVPFLFFNLIFFILWPIFGRIGIWDKSFSSGDSIISIYYNFLQNTIIKKCLFLICFSTSTKYLLNVPTFKFQIIFRILFGDISNFLAYLSSSFLITGSSFQ